MTNPASTGSAYSAFGARLYTSYLEGSTIAVTGSVCRSVHNNTDMQWLFDNSRIGESHQRCRASQVAITVTALALKGNLTSVRKAAPAAGARRRRNAPASVLVSRA